MTTMCAPNVAESKKPKSELVCAVGGSSGRVRSCVGSGKLRPGWLGWEGGQVPVDSTWRATLKGQPPERGPKVARQPHLFCDITPSPSAPNALPPVLEGKGSSVASIEPAPDDWSTSFYLDAKTIEPPHLPNSHPLSTALSQKIHPVIS